MAGEQPVLLLVDTAGCDMEEAAEEGGDSLSNPGEAQVPLPLPPASFPYLLLIPACHHADRIVLQQALQLLACHPQHSLSCSHSEIIVLSRAQAVLAHAQALVEAGVSPADIGIITPYNAQVQATSAALFAWPC